MDNLLFKAIEEIETATNLAMQLPRTDKIDKMISFLVEQRKVFVSFTSEILKKG